VSDIILSGTPLPAIPGEPVDELTRMTAAWLLAQKSPHTRTAYRRNVTGIGTNGEPAEMTAPAWLPWCEQNGLEPLKVRRGHVDAYRLVLEAAGCSPNTVAQRLAAVSSWYDYLLDEELTERNPAKRVKRPSIDRDDSPTVSLSLDEAKRFLVEAEVDGPLTNAVIKMLALNGIRVSVVLNARPRDFGYDSGHRIVRFVLKGGKRLKAPVADEVNEAIEAYKRSRGRTLAADELLFVRPGDQPLDDSWMRRLVQRIAKQAGIPSWRDLSAHSLRHTFGTLALAFGIPLAVVQDAMGHADPRTTQAYNHGRHRLDNHPTYTLAKHLLPSPEPSLESLRDAEPLPQEASET
jgi:site-specific recombinase XerD